MTIDPIDQQRRDRAALEAEISVAGSNIRGSSCNCPHPEHDDADPSAAIYQAGDGAWRAKCYSCGWCGDVFDLRAVLQGRPLDDVLREARGDNGRAKPQPSRRDWLTIAKRAHANITADRLRALADSLGVSADALRRLRVGWITAAELSEVNTKCKADGCYTFPMRDGTGHVVGIRLRTADGFKYAIQDCTQGLHVPADLAGEGKLYIVEGPSDLAALLDMGFDGIGRPSNQGGDEYIIDHIQRHAYEAATIITDNDTKAAAAPTTQRAAEELASRLVPLVGAVRIIQPPKGFKDVRAWHNAGAGADDVEARADQARSRGPAGELGAMLQAEIDGTRRAIPWPWRLVTRGTQALLPGNVVILCGDPGDGKSLWLLEALAHWHDNGVPCAIYELEQTRAYHLKRALAQRVGASWLTDLEAVNARPDEAMAHHAEHEAWTDAIGRRMYDAPNEPIKLLALTEWIEARASEGARIIAIDPITAAETSERPWDDAQKFLHSVKPILDRHGASLVLVTHPKKGKQKGTPSTLDDLAGGAAWQRFAQCILWMQRHDDPKTVNVKRFGEAMPIPQAEQINRTLRVMKARDGCGAGWQLAFDFDPQTLRFHERGAIVKQNQHSEACA